MSREAVRGAAVGAAQAFLCLEEVRQTCAPAVGFLIPRVSMASVSGDVRNGGATIL